MIKRIVKMSFHPEHAEAFVSVYRSNWKRISGFPGCRRVELLRVNDASIFFTYSLWDSEADLEAYRASEVFAEVWQKTKVYFNDKPEAWTVTEITDL